MHTTHPRAHQFLSWGKASKSLFPGETHHILDTEMDYKPFGFSVANEPSDRDDWIIERLSPVWALGWYNLGFRFSPNKILEEGRFAINKKIQDLGVMGKVHRIAWAVPNSLKFGNIIKKDLATSTIVDSDWTWKHKIVRMFVFPSCCFLKVLRLLIYLYLNTWRPLTKKYTLEVQNNKNPFKSIKASYSSGQFIATFSRRLVTPMVV